MVITILHKAEICQSLMQSSVKIERYNISPVKHVTRISDLPVCFKDNCFKRDNFNPTALKTAKTLQRFGRSECNSVKQNC